MKGLKKIFLNEKLITAVILINSILLFIQESGVNFRYIYVMDVVCTAIFIVEMGVKINVYGFNGYWSTGWNRLDGILVILSIPSLVGFFFPALLYDVSVLMVLRLLRVFRFFRVIHIFPGFTRLLNNFLVAMRRSYAVFLGMLVMIFIFAMLGCSLFKDVAPEYFSTPLNAIYSTFRIFTGEGWNEIPDVIAQNVSSGWEHAVRLYFCMILILGCIVGMSLLNSVFVDAMVSDGDDGIDERLKSIESKLDEIQSKL
jgi:voltage-gated sodium channel